MTDKPLAIGLGEVLWDMLPGGPTLGGAPANFAYMMEQFGYHSCVISAVGQDDLGRKALAELKEKIQFPLISALPYPTGKVEVSLDAQGVPHYQFARDVAWDHLPYNPESVRAMQQARVVSWGTLASRSAESQTTIEALLNHTPADCLKVFDMNIRQDFYSMEFIKQSIVQCDILKINEVEAELLIPDPWRNYHPGQPQEQWFKMLKDYNLKSLIITHGATGSEVYNQPQGNAEYSFIPADKIDVVDTVGAGDAFTAAYCTGFLRQGFQNQAHSRAAEVSSYVCTCRGAMPHLPRELLL